MSSFIYSGSAQVEVQDVACLQWMDRQLDFTAYEAVGFNGRLTLIDYRRHSLSQIKPNQPAAQFRYHFNRPALIDVWYLGSEQIWLELYDTPDAVPPVTLSLSLLEDELVPVYDTIYQHATPQANGRTAFLALYHTTPAVFRPRQATHWPVAIAAD